MAAGPFWYNFEKFQIFRAHFDGSVTLYYGNDCCVGLIPAMFSGRFDLEQNLEIEVIEAAARGDIDSFAALYNRYYNSMVAIAMSLLGDRHLAEDVAQETFGCISVNNAPVHIGSNSEKEGFLWNGMIDDVRIYSYALTADEVGAIYESAVTTSAE